jgi:hypothetical protein
MSFELDESIYLTFTLGSYSYLLHNLAPLKPKTLSSLSCILAPGFFLVILSSVVFCLLQSFFAFSLSVLILYCIAQSWQMNRFRSKSFTISPYKAIFRQRSANWDCRTLPFSMSIHPKLLYTMFTSALHWSNSWAKSIQSIPPFPIPLRSILILFTHVHLGLLSGLFPSGFPTNILYAFLLSSCVLHALQISSFLCSFLHPPVT